jgi:hypothetical protein
MKKNYLSNPDYTYEKVNRASLACGPMCKWAIAQVRDKLVTIGYLIWFWTCGFLAPKEFYIIWFLYARLETGRIMWLGMAAGRRPHRFSHNNFSSVYRIFTKLGHMIPLWKGKNPIYFGVKGQGNCYFKYNFWQQGRFRMITLVLYIGSLPNLATWFPCGRGRILFILGSLGQRSRSPLL